MDNLQEKLNNIDFNVSEIFYSIQGEGNMAGKPCIFIRLQGCELRCEWCDTPYALDIKSKELEMTGMEIVDSIKKYDCNYILFTGGEPLLQKNINFVIDYLINENYFVSIETNGHQSIEKVNKKAVKIIDFKAPGSGMSKFNNFDNLNFLQKTDEVKVIISDRQDYDWAKKFILEQNLHEKVLNVILSPEYGKLNSRILAEWILEDSLPVRLQLQIHKYIWHPDKRGV